MSFPANITELLRSINNAQVCGFFQRNYPAALPEEVAIWLRVYGHHEGQIVEIPILDISSADPVQFSTDDLAQLEKRAHGVVRFILPYPDEGIEKPDHPDISVSFGGTE